MEKQATLSAAGKECSKDLERAYELLQIFAKTSQLLKERNAKVARDLADFETCSQVQRHTIQELYQQVRVFMETSSYAYPGSATGAYNLLITPFTIITIHYTHSIF